MSTISARDTAVKPPRTVRLHHAPRDGQPGCMTIWEQKGKNLKSTWYWVEPITADFGNGFKLTKFLVDGGETYHVNLNGERSSCECKGFLRWGHCRHIESLTALRNQGQL